MARAPVLYQETRITPAPVSPSSVLLVNTDHNTAVGTTTSAGRKRLFEETAGLDEEDYARKRLATEGSVFFRPLTKLPRSFLWRVLDNRKLLEVQCVDLVQARKGRHEPAESLLTFQIPFSSEILPSCIQFADAGEKDALELFVLTAGNDFYTVTFRRDLLLRETIPTAFDPATCVKKFVPSSFSFRHPYRLAAISNLEVFISLHDGGLMRLERNANESGSQWRETFFSEGGWSGTIKSWNPFGKSQTIRYGNRELEASAIASLAKSPTGEYVWTVSLDHTLKAWDTKTGKVVAQTDLLGEKTERDDKNRSPQYLISAEQRSLLQVVSLPTSVDDRSVARTDDLGNHYIVVYSPKDHQFKFYAATTTFSSIEGAGIELRDMQPDTKFIPPVEELLDTNIWHLEHFAVCPGPYWRESQLWLRARSGAVCKTFMLTFTLSADSGVWKSGWATVDADSLSTQSLKLVPEFSSLEVVGSTANAATTPSDRWLDFVFYPGRFSEDSLETALRIFRKGRGLPMMSGRGINAEEQPLKERLTTAILAKIPLRHLNDQPDYDQYQTDLQAQWNTFYSILAHLHNRRHDAIGFAFDAETGLPWTICADFVAPIRTNSTFENLCLNTDLVDLETTVDQEAAVQIFSEGDEDAKKCRVLAIAKQFRQYLSATSQKKLQTLAVDNALGLSEEISAESALRLLHTTCGFANEVSDDDFEALNAAAEVFDGLGSLNDEHFLMVLEGLDEAVKTRGVDQGQVLGRYGGKLSIAIVQETVQRMHGVLLDLLALVTFMHGELEPSELDSEFRPQEIYEAIMMRLRQTELRLWLASNVRQEPHRTSKGSGDSAEESVTMTIFESMFIGDWDSGSNTYQSALPELLTTWSKRWTFYLNLTSLWDDVTCHVMANLLRNKNLDLASDFLKFMDDGPWQSYLKGRHSALAGRYDEASVFFTAYIDDISEFTPTSFINADLLNAEELNYFGHGKTAYLQHIVSLFEKSKVYSHVADFAMLALEDLDTDGDLMQSIIQIDARKTETDSPIGARIGNAMDEIRVLRLLKIRDEILNRLFNALVQTGRFEKAFEALTSISKPEMQKANLQILLQTCAKQDSISTLLELPITGDLAHDADAILLALAKQSMTSSSTSATPQYDQILFAFRTQQANFRGAAAVLYEHLERLRHGSKFSVRDPEDETLVQLYALLINTLACCGEDQAWLLANPAEGAQGQEQKRKLIRLEDVRKEYAAELDQRSDMLLGRFPLVGGGDEMDVL